MHGFETTKKLFCEIACQSSDKLIRRMISQGEKWAAGEKQEDDITMLSIKIKLPYHNQQDVNNVLF